MNRIAALALIAVSPLALSGCGLHPLYADGGTGPVASALSSVDVAPIGGQRGWLVRNALNDRLHHQRGTARYRLEVELNDNITGIGVDRSTNAITRENRVLRARYRLVDATTGTVLLDQTAMANAGLDVAQSEYATAAAEQTALERLSESLADQIVGRISAYARRSTAPAPAGQ